MHRQGPLVPRLVVVLEVVATEAPDALEGVLCALKLSHGAASESVA